MMRMAWTMAWRITGSPLRATSRFSNERGSRSASPSMRTSRPVSISAQVDALTNSNSLWPMWRSQWAPPILSAMSLSAVSASGTRSSASARHMSITPSWLDRSYSCMKASRPPSSRAFSRIRSTMVVAIAAMRRRAPSPGSASRISASTHPSSSARVAARMAARSGSGSWKSPTKVIAAPCPRPILKSLFD